MSTHAVDATGDDLQRQAVDAFVEAARGSHFNKVCAFNSVYVAARLSGYDLTFHDVLRAVPLPKAAEGISIKAICNALDRLGVKYFVRYQTDRYDGNPRGAGIAYTAPEARGGIGHVWVLRRQGDLAQVIDPPHPVKLVMPSQPLMKHSMMVYVLPPDATLRDRLSAFDWMSSALRVRAALRHLRPDREALAAPALLPIPVRSRGAGAAGKPPHPRGEAHAGAVGQSGQRLHLEKRSSKLWPAT